MGDKMNNRETAYFYLFFRALESVWIDPDPAGACVMVLRYGTACDEWAAYRV